jgi:hypothetical protein
VDWRRLESDEAFLTLFDRQSGAAGQEIASIEKQIFDLVLQDPVKLATLKGLRMGLLRVQEVVSELAAEEDRQRKAEILEATPRPRPADDPFPPIF